MAGLAKAVADAEVLGRSCDNYHISHHNFGVQFAHVSD